VFGVDSLGQLGLETVGPADVLVRSGETVADTAQSAVRYERGDWGRESHAAVFDGLLGRGAHLHALLWGNGWGGDRLDAPSSWDEQHFEGRVHGPVGWLAFRGRKHDGDVLVPVGGTGSYETRVSERSDWSLGLRLPRGIRLEGEWSEGDERWKGDSATTVAQERGSAAGRYRGTWGSLKVAAETRWVQELLREDLSGRSRQWRHAAAARIGLGDDGAVDGWVAVRGDAAGWGLRVEAPSVRGWRVSVGAGSAPGLRGVRERVTGAPRERWSGGGVSLGRSEPWEWTLWARGGRLKVATYDLEQPEQPWWDMVAAKQERDVTSVGLVTRLRWRILWLSGWGERLSYHDAASGEGVAWSVWEPVWRGLVDFGGDVRLSADVTARVGGTVRGEALERPSDGEERNHVVATVWGGLQVSRALLYVCMVQPTGADWEEILGYPLSAPMVYGGIEWKFLG
jgi:hypothetical protein